LNAKLCGAYPRATLKISSRNSLEIKTATNDKNVKTAILFVRFSLSVSGIFSILNKRLSCPEIG
jgi:hypothetical protein